VLTPTDIHYLVGLLSLAAHAENVELELGDFVRDEASESRRDVDVTITARNPDGSRAAYMGIEVKAHGRPSILPLSKDWHRNSMTCVK
jgi:hypothetical protein